MFLDISVLRLFLDVCDEESISKAALQNYISRQALTASMNRLEAEIGADLFVRSATGIKMTEEGRFFRQSAEKIVSLWERTLSKMKNVGRYESTIRMGLSLAITDDALIARLIARQLDFSDRYLEVIDAGPNLCWEMLKEEQLDVAFTLCPHGHPDLVSVPVRTPFRGCYLLVSVNDGLAGEGEIKQELLRGRTVLFPDDSVFSSTRISQYCRQAGAEVLVVPAIHTVQKTLVEDSVGYALVPGGALMQFRSPKVVADDEISQVARDLACQIGEHQSAFGYEIDLDGTVRFSGGPVSDSS